MPKLDPATPERAVAAVEDLATGDPFAGPVREAEAAVEELRDAAAGELFDALGPTSDAALRDLDLATRNHRRDADTFLVELHSEALDGGHDELASLIRSPRGRRMVAAAARSRAHPLHHRETNAAAAERAEREALARWQRLIAGQLVGVEAHEPAATIIAETVPALQARLEVSVAAHEAHAATEAARLEAEAREADRAIDQERRRRADALAAKAAAHERQRRNAEREARAERAAALAARVEKLAGTTGAIRLERDQPYSAADLLRLLRANQVSVARMEQIEAILDQRRGAA